MGFRPMPNIESTLIRFKQGVKEDYKKFTDDIDKYLKGMLWLPVWMLDLQGNSPGRL